jgi:hypothetical protein
VFTRNAALLATSMPQEAVKKLIVPLLVRAADQGGTAVRPCTLTSTHCRYCTALVGQQHFRLHAT